jgi:hypothetical protein
MSSYGGYTYKMPDGTLGRQITSTRKWSMSNAAFAFSDRGTITMPYDWKRAYRKGWRVVPVQVTELP